LNANFKFIEILRQKEGGGGRLLNVSPKQESNPTELRALGVWNDVAIPF